ncbi:urease accessory protein UreE [uncultured Cocleimonas sp.]|uniref:urease accessory protein UreE n=1 Tax=uncultured Cocleimonas sp. TaxID=1051587 RepID=UPI0026059CFA|nr:urease accessory protein UreE [uncultured Cocleimonas sp.]
MIKFETKTDKTDAIPQTSLTLGKDQREKSRLKVTLDDGREGGLFFDKGTSFQDGDLIISADGETLVEIKAAAETVSMVHCDDPLLLAKACYHLGNRHIPLQIDATELRYQHDHVLDEMVRGFGLTVTTEQAPFEPESGAYSGGGHHHHSGDHDHSHDHHQQHQQHSHSHD